MDVYKKIQKEIVELRAEATNQVFSLTEELQQSERILRSEERQKEYQLWYRAFVASHPAPSEYEKQLSDYIVDMYVQNTPDLDATIQAWAKRVDVLQRKLAQAKDIQKQLDRLSFTTKAAK